MKLMFPILDAPVSIDGEYVNSLVVENQKCLYSLLIDLYSQINKSAGPIVLSDKDKILDISKKVELVTQFVPFEINSKSLLTKLNNQLKSIANEDFYIEGREVTQRVLEYAFKICDKVPYDLIVKDIDIADVIKLVDVKFDMVPDSLSEQLYDYSNIITELEGEKLFIFVGSKAYINENEYFELCKLFVGHKIPVLFIDNSLPYSNKYESILTIDSDLCVI